MTKIMDKRESLGGFASLRSHRRSHYGLSVSAPSISRDKNGFIYMQICLTLLLADALNSSLYVLGEFLI